MSEKMTHDEYVAQVRMRVANVAQRMLDEKLSFIEGAREICALRDEVDVPQDDGDFAVFDLIESETDALPFGPVRKHWSPTALENLEPEFRQSGTLGPCNSYRSKPRPRSQI
ncbi:MAG: DUF2489 domain-containing protein [Betaproteobacteria bacterium]|nr:DUF2489 domain-containing protein [Betaproteobacteria bacterium]